MGSANFRTHKTARKFIAFELTPHWLRLWQAHHQEGAVHTSENTCVLEAIFDTNACSPGKIRGAAYVQLSDDSRNSAIHTAYRNSSHPSSPRQTKIKLATKVTNKVYQLEIVRRFRKRKNKGALAGKRDVMRAGYSGSIKCDWSFRRFTYGNLVTTSPSSKW